MDTNNIMILAIIVTSLATFSSRFLGVVLITCVAIFILTKKNLVLPTIFSAVFLSILTNL